MAITVVNLTDTFDEWRIKTNAVHVLAGDLTTLSTTAKGTLVAAINEIFTNDSDDLENIVEDTSPALGGDLVLSGNDITGTGNITFTGILTATSIAGTVAGTTQSVGNNTTLLATTAFVTTAVTSEDQLSEMNDVTITSIANDNILQYNSSSSVWENQVLEAGVSTDDATALAIALG